MKVINLSKKIKYALPYFFLSTMLISGGVLLTAETNQHEHNESSHKGEDDHNLVESNDEEDTHNHGDKKSKEEGHGHGDEKNKKDDGHGHDAEKEPTSDVELSPEQIKIAGIKTQVLKKQPISHQITALGEVKLNQYKTINVSPELTTRVEKRHVRLGDKVEKGQLLITLHTLSTPDMSASLSADKLSRADLNASISTTIAEMEANIAQAKGELAIANANWSRLRSLGKDAVSGKRYTAAKIARNQAAAKLQAYQRSRAKIKTLGAPAKPATPFVQKHYKVRAEQAGTIIKDDFVLGQVVNPEDILIIISDMEHLWVEANIKPEDAAKISKGSNVNIQSNNKKINGKVINIGRVIDEKTRTLPIRVEINTENAVLYPGQFVKTKIDGLSNHLVTVVPSEAVLRSADGDWILFIEKASGRFEPKEVEVVENRGDKVIIEGINTGETIVIKGAFTLQSELAKGGFEVHNH